MFACRPLLALALASAAAVGCASKADSTASSEPAFTGSADQAGIDVQVLQVWTPGKVWPKRPETATPAPNDVTIDAPDPTVCKTIATLPSINTTGGAGDPPTYEDRTVDCADAIAKAAPFDVTKVPGPLMTPARFNVSKRLVDGYNYVDPDYCNRIEVRVVVRDASLNAPSFAGIGFWTSRMDGETFTNKADLQVVGHTRLANGDDASVVRFTGLSTCISGAHNSTSGNAYQTFAFKPYAAFDADNGAGKRYRVWENISGNHQLGRSWPGQTPAVNSTGFDRQGELLAH